jgi:hypothetical protein
VIVYFLGRERLKIKAAVSNLCRTRSFLAGGVARTQPDNLRPREIIGTTPGTSSAQASPDLPGLAYRHYVLHKASYC